MADVGERCHLWHIRRNKFVRHLNMNHAVIKLDVGFATPPDIDDTHYVCI